MKATEYGAVTDNINKSREEMKKQQRTNTSNKSENNINKLPDIKLRTSAQTDEDKYEITRKDSRKRVEWSREEVAALMNGVQKYGPKNWTKIIHENRKVFDKNRRVVDLLHKYKQRTKTSSFYKTSKKDWVEIDGENNVKTDAMGEIISHSEKFPYDAAMRFAKKYNFEGYRTFVLRIRQADDKTNIHAYNVTVDSEKIKLRKLTNTNLFE